MIDIFREISEKLYVLSLITFPEVLIRFCQLMAKIWIFIIDLFSLCISEKLPVTRVDFILETGPPTLQIFHTVSLRQFHSAPNGGQFSVGTVVRSDGVSVSGGKVEIFTEL